MKALLAYFLGVATTTLVVVTASHYALVFACLGALVSSASIYLYKQFSGRFTMVNSQARPIHHSESKAARIAKSSGTVPGRPSASKPAMSQIQLDVVSALVNLGMAEPAARRRVRSHPPADLDNLLRSCLKA